MIQYGIETKGRTLDEIQRDLARKVVDLDESRGGSMAKLAAYGAVGEDGSPPFQRSPEIQIEVRLNDEGSGDARGGSSV